MSSEMEALGAASIGAVRAHQRADLSDQACRNCGAEIADRYCSTCGQLAASFHRPIWSLITESVADTFALDGRLARTLPLLFLRPGRLTRNYSSGQRARYVPPFRLFLLASVLFYFALFAIVGNASWVDELKGQVATEGAVVTAEEGEQGVAEFLQSDGTIDRERALAAIGDGETLDPGADRALNEAFDAVDDPQAFLNSIERWAPRLSLLLLPVTILTLALMSFWRRRVYIYDHAIHALHLHSWLYLSGTALILIGMLIPPITGLLVPFTIFYFIFYMIRSLAVSTSASHVLAVVRFIGLFVVWVVFLAIIILLLIIVGALEA